MIGQTLAAQGFPGTVYIDGDAIHSAGTIVSDFVLKIAPLITAQTTDMARFIPPAEALQIET